MHSIFVNYLDRCRTLCKVILYIHVILLNTPYRKFLLCKCFFNILNSRVEICVTDELRSVINLLLDIMVLPHTKNVHVSCRMHFELAESFGLVLCDVH